MHTIKFFVSAILLVRVFKCYFICFIYREILTLKDGGEIALDWRYPKTNGPQSLFTVILLTGLTGDSQAEYIRETVNVLSESGYCSVVFNYRGRGGVKLKVGYNIINY